VESARERPPVAPAPEPALPETPPTPPAATAARTVAAVPAETAGPGSREIVVLDEQGVWARASTEARPIVAVSPRDVRSIVCRDAARRIIANPRARHARCLGEAPGGGCTVPFWGCLAAPGANRGVPLGLVEVAVRPLDPEVVLAALRGHATRGTRVLTAGADADALISLRQALAREGMSVSMAWDGKQAGELLGMIRPEVVVLELDLPPRAGYGIVAQLSGRNPLPLAVLIPSAEDPAERFAALLGNQMYAPAFVPLTRIVVPAPARTEKRAGA
jgi:CheY-like chemotaxis protein